MRWYQVHLRVLSRLFELGLFDEVNASYRNYSLNRNTVNKELFKSLVITDDIKLYCNALSENKLARNAVNVSNILISYFKTTACFTIVKALQDSVGISFDTIKITDEIPANCYQVLFTEMGELKDEVLINAFNHQGFTNSPKDLVSTFLKFDYENYLSFENFKIDTITDDYFKLACKLNLTSEAAQDIITNYDYRVLNKLQARKKAYRIAEKNAADTQGINYFNSYSKLDSGFGLLQVIDLLGMHLLLVAQRRKFLFEGYRCDDLRSHYKALEKVNSDDIVRLHNNAVLACNDFLVARKAIISKKGNLVDFNIIVKAYVARNDALYQYICYFGQLFSDLKPNFLCTNRMFTWEVEYYYFNLYDAFIQLSHLQAKLLANVEKLLGLNLDLVKYIGDPIKYDSEILNNVFYRTPAGIYELCAHFAPYFDSAKLCHPSVVNFQDIVNSVMSYSQGLTHVKPTMPYPIKKGSEYDIEDSGDPSWLKREETDLVSINQQLAYELISDPKPIVFSRKLNIYLDMFCLASNFVEHYNHFYFTTIYASIQELMTNSKARFAFDLTYSDQDVVTMIYPLYERLLKDETFCQLLECHQACFERLVLIMDLQGDTHLLYEDNYMSHWLRHTNNYDQELADSLALNKRASESSDTPNLSKAEQLLLNKTCISYLQDCQKLCQLSKALINKTIELDELLNETLSGFISNKAQIFGRLQNVFLLPIRALTQYAILNLDNVPEELKANTVLASQSALIYERSTSDGLVAMSDTEVNQQFYQCFYETLLAISAKDMNLFGIEIIPYTNFATKEDFAKALNKFALILNNDCSLRRSNYIVMVAYKRLLESNNYDQAIIRQVSNNALVSNAALSFLLEPYSSCLKLLLIPIVKFFVRTVMQFTRVKQVEESHEYLNVIYNLVNKLAKFLAANPAKINNLKTLVDQGNVVLCERFEYQSYMSEIVDLLSLCESLCLKYMDTYEEFSITYDFCEISDFLALYKDLLEDSPKVLQCIDVDYFKNLLNNPSTSNVVPYFNDQDYVSMNSNYFYDIMEICGDRLSIAQLYVVEHFFGKDVSALIKAEDDAFYGGYLFWHYFTAARSRPKELKKTSERIINLLTEKFHLLDDVQLHQVLNIESQKIATHIVDSSNSASIGKPKAKASTAKSKTATVKSKATEATKSKAQNAATTAASEIDADVITEDKPKAKSTRSKAKKAEAATGAEAESKPKSKSATKATATKSRDKKLATTSANEATATADSVEFTEAKPQKKATRAKKASTATAKATAGKDASAQAILEGELEADANPKAKSTRSKAKKAEEGSEEKTKAKSTNKATATKSRAKKVAAVASTEAKAEDAAEVTDAAKVAEAAPKKKAATARTTSKASSSSRAKKSTAKS